MTKTQPRILVKIFAFILVLVSMLNIVLPVSAKKYSPTATIGQTKCVVSVNTESTKSQVKWRREYYEVKNGKTIKLSASCNTSLHPVCTTAGKKIADKTLVNLVRFDIYVYDDNGTCVKYQDGLRNGGTFKVQSNMKGISQKKYTVKVVSYIADYKTRCFRAGDNGALSMCLKYNVKYK